MGARRITFSEGQMNMDEALKEVEERKASLLDQAEAGFLPPEKNGQQRGLNLRETIDAMVPDEGMEETKDAAEKYNILWEKVLARFPEKADRDLLTQAYTDIFIPEALEAFQVMDAKQRKISDPGGHVIWAEQEKKNALSRKVESGRKMVKFLDEFEKANDELKRRKAERESSDSYVAEKLKSEQERAETLLKSLMSAEVDVISDGPVAQKEKLSDIIEKVGEKLNDQKDRKSLSSKEAKELTKGTATVARHIIEICPETRDRELLIARLKRDEVRIGNEYQMMVATDLQTEMNPEKKERQAQKLAEYLKIRYLYDGLSGSI